MPRSFHVALAVALTSAFFVASACSEDDERPPFTPDVERNSLYPTAVDRPPIGDGAGGTGSEGQAGAAQSPGAAGSSSLPPTGGAGGALGVGGSAGADLGAGGTADLGAGGTADLGAGGAVSDPAIDAGLGGGSGL
ncbi:MAG: hypothetical protein ABW217_10100 [Polyangiaceae bacterium]